MELVKVLVGRHRSVLLEEMTEGRDSFETDLRRDFLLALPMIEQLDSMSKPCADEPFVKVNSEFLLEESLQATQRSVVEFGQVRGMVLRLPGRAFPIRNPFQVAAHNSARPRGSAVVSVVELERAEKG